MGVDTTDDLQSLRRGPGMFSLRERGQGLDAVSPGYLHFGKGRSIKVPPYEARVRVGEPWGEAILSWVKGSESQAERADEIGPGSFWGVHAGPTVVKHEDGSIFISLHASSAEAAVRSLEVLVDQGFDSSRPPERIDEMNGVIREVAGSEVSVSLFDGEDEFCVELPRKIFEDGGVPVREDEGFEFFVERYSDGSEKPVVRPLPRRELSSEEREQIVNEIDEVLDGERSRGGP